MSGKWRYSIIGCTAEQQDAAHSGKKIDQLFDFPLHIFRYEHHISFTKRGFNHSILTVKKVIFHVSTLRINMKNSCD